MLVQLLLIYMHVNLIINTSYIKCQKYATRNTVSQNGEYEPPEIEIEAEDTTPGLSSTLIVANVTNEQTSTEAGSETTSSTSKRETTTVLPSNATKVTTASKKSIHKVNNLITKTLNLSKKHPKEKSGTIKGRRHENLKTVTRKPLKVEKDKTSSRVELKHSFISGPDWHDLIKEPSEKFSSKISRNNIRSPFSLFNQFNEISFEQGWEPLKLKDKHHKKAAKSKKTSPKRKNRKISKTTTVWPKKTFKAKATISKVKFPVEFRLSDILPNPENVKLFSFKDNIKTKETTFQYDHPNSISPFRTIFRFGNFRKFSPSTKTDKERGKSKSNSLSRRIYRKKKENKKSSQPLRKNKTNKGVSLETHNKLKGLPDRSFKKNNSIPNRKHILQSLNHLKMNVEEMLFDVDHASDIIPFLMMGVAVP